MNNKAILSRITKENAFCADCSTKDPKWASTTFGVFVCTECSGVHRSLQNGTLSNIKPLEGNFTVVELGYLSQMGNQKANEILEGNTQSMTKPNPKSPYGEKEKWIKMKYEEKKFSSQQNFQLGDGQERNRSSTLSTVKKQGFLNKQGGSVKSWKRRYFILSQTYLSYYKSPGDPSPVGVIQLLFSTVRTFPEERERENCFGIITPARTYIFQADTGAEISPWIDQIKEAITVANSGNPEKKLDSSGNEESDIVDGFLLKEGNNVVKDWKKRWFVLQGENLHYYNKKNDRTPLGVIVLASCSAKVSESKSKRFCIEIITPTRSYWVAAENAEEMHKWVRAIRNASKSILQGRMDEGSPKVIRRESNTPSPITPHNNNINNNYNHNNMHSQSGPIQPNPNTNPNQHQHSNSSPNIPPPVPRMRPNSIQVPRGNSMSNLNPNITNPVTPINPFNPNNNNNNMNNNLMNNNQNSPNVLPRNINPGAVPIGPGGQIKPSVPNRPQPPSNRHSTLNLSSPSLRSASPNFSSPQITVNNTNNNANNNPITSKPLDKKYTTQPNLFNVGRASAMSSPPEPAQPKQGWLNKMGNNMIKDWQKRWVIVKPNAIEYYKNKLDAIATGVIPLSSVQVHSNQNVRASCFEIVTPNRSYYFAAENPIEMAGWISAVSANIHALRPDDPSADKQQLLATTQSTISQDGSFSGWIMKQGKKGLKPWRRRWACLKGDNLYYYANENDEVSLGVISVLLCTVKTTEQGGSFFDIVTPNRIYHFQAKDKVDLLNWINHIRTASEQLYNELPSAVQTDQVKIDESESQDNNRDRIKELLNMAANKRCADCFNPDPDWASINLGIFLCIECAGAHRKLGVHLSKVRSVALDRWETEVVDFMGVMGNELSNSIYEYLIPQSYPRPTNSDSREEREKFIRLKYEKATWADPSKVQKGAGPVKKNLMALYKAGYLTKQGNSIKTWKRRWFVLKLTDDTASLFYYKIRGDATPAGGIDVRTSAVRSPVLGISHAFEVITPNRIYCITAATDEERDSWVERLREIIELYDSKA